MSAATVTVHDETASGRRTNTLTLDFLTARITVRVPAGRRPLVLSEDDVNYYHYFDGRGLAARLVLAGDQVRAQRPGGTLTEASGPVTFTGGPYPVANPSSQATGTPTCNAVLVCDDFVLTVSGLTSGS